MSSKRDAIKRVVEAFERSGWSEIDVRAGDVRVHLSTTAPTGPPTTPADNHARAAAHTDPVENRWASEAADAPAGGRGDPSVTTRAGPPVADGAHLVVSPSPGIFWRSPEPGLPPFADVGLSVDSSATVCIVEVMKLMNHVKAGVGGEVVAVFVENGVAVEKGQALFAIARSDPS